MAPCALERYSSILSSTLCTLSSASVTAVSAAIIFSCVFLRFSCRFFSSAVCAMTAAVSAGSVCCAWHGSPPRARHDMTVRTAILILFIPINAFMLQYRYG